ncbi:DUF1292 domain-containing protein [Brevibacillus humidisoli]|uniref:DUF1292 domain-containing protein n=1 Tax=Brevibacillus humidisoli TaxID=2895522 RepID=UPI001E610026|nr:DUF1292 domain-containing protein [Brevibacillus humidisoli]UFJ42290.1 DUF1292 domain-containing protein [Brevibacillus humidisoli]
MSSEVENKALEVGDVISLDDENGEVVGDFEVIALFELNGRQYVALTPALEEEPANDEEELDVFILGLENNELTALDEEEEEEAFAKLDELLEDAHVSE